MHNVQKYHSYSKFKFKQNIVLLAESLPTKQQYNSHSVQLKLILNWGITAHRYLGLLSSACGRVYTPTSATHVETNVTAAGVLSPQVLV
jgi:hypothetical protein